MKKLLGIALTVTVLCGGGVAMAETTTSTSAQIQALLVQIQQLQNQLNQLQTQKQAAIENLVEALQEGSTGDQVTILQAILAADPSIYPEGRITGFFGALTKQAVHRFQEKNGLPSVGVVGPLTRGKLNQLLEVNQLSFEDEDEDATSTHATSTAHHACAIVPPGHLIAAGWLKKMDGVRPIVPACQHLPKGIMDNMGRSTSSTSTVDTVAPVISGITSTVSTSSATIKWHTNEFATAQVWYGTSTTLGSSTTLNVNLMKEHSQILSGLTASSTYYYSVGSKDAAGNLATSSQQTFATLAE